MQAKANNTSKLPVLSRREVEDIKSKIDADKSYLGQLDRSPSDDPGTHLPAKQVVEIDTGAVESRIRRNEKALAAMDPANQKLSGEQRKKSESRYFQLKDIIVKKMLTREEMDYFPSANDGVKQANYELAVRKATEAGYEGSQEYNVSAQEFKRLGRLLWPEDPEMCSLSKIRPRGNATSGRHFAKV